MQVHFFYMPSKVFFCKNKYFSKKPQNLRDARAVVKRIYILIWYMKKLNKRSLIITFFIHLTTISTELGFLWEFVRLSLRTCTFYHEKLFIQVVNDIRTQVFNNFFSASDIMEAVRGRLCFYRYECNARLRDTS